MAITNETKSTLKQALISVIIGAAVAFIVALIEGLLGVLKSTIFNYAGVPLSMLYFLKKRVIV